LLLRYIARMATIRINRKILIDTKLCGDISGGPRVFD